MIGRLRQLSEPRLRQQAGIEKPQTPVERDILVQWVRKCTDVLKYFFFFFFVGGGGGGGGGGAGRAM